MRLWGLRWEGNIPRAVARRNPENDHVFRVLSLLDIGPKVRTLVGATVQGFLNLYAYLGDKVLAVFSAWGIITF